MNISENIKQFLEKLPKNIKLVAVTKSRPIEDILKAYNSGYKIFGENKVQELINKYEKLPKDIEWHMIGHLQTNKVKFIAGFVYLIHSVDSLKLLKTINKEAIKNNRIINVLLQIHIAQEETKFGQTFAQIKEILSSDEYKELKNIKIVGLMGMATFTDDVNIIRTEFQYLASCFKELKNSSPLIGNKEFKELSMGMSQDYNIAIQQGTTIVRVGSLIFGEINY